MANAVNRFTANVESPMMPVSPSSATTPRPVASPTNRMTIVSNTVPMDRYTNISMIAMMMMVMIVILARLASPTTIVSAVRAP